MTDTVTSDDIRAALDAALDHIARLRVLLAEQEATFGRYAERLARHDSLWRQFMHERRRADMAERRVELLERELEIGRKGTTSPSAPDASSPAGTRT